MEDAEHRLGASRGPQIAQPAGDAGGLARERDASLLLPGSVRRSGRPDEELDAVGVVAGHDERLFELLDRLVVRPERRGPLRRGGEREARLDGDGVRLGARLRGVVGRQVVRRERPGELLVAERLEVAGRGQVPRPAIASSERPVRDLADERLDELVLASLR